ncbi:MAG: phosphatidylserine decarboxylase [Acidobacteriia bacterium]|nr:phosphatidylserine decarboxylase [Terriglobia bacterium]
MVRDGYYYALASLVVAGLIAWLASPPWAVIPLAFGAFCAWFFRDPERQIPAIEDAIVSPGDGRVTDIVSVEQDGRSRTRISIFLSVFDVHVNRSPIGGVIRDVQYRKGLFKNAMGAASADCNEQNIVTLDDGRQAVVFKQIAGLIARRIVFTKRVGDAVARGERIGLIKFGSRCDVIFDAAASVQVTVGQHVSGGSSILALAPVCVPAPPEREPRNPERKKGVLR